MPTGMVLLPLEREKLMNGRYSNRIATPDPHLPTPRPIRGLVADHRSPLLHDLGARHLLRVHLKWLAEIAGTKRGLDVAHVCADRGDGRGVTRVVAIQQDPPTVGQVLEYVR